MKGYTDSPNRDNPVRNKGLKFTFFFPFFVLLSLSLGSLGFLSCILLAIACDFFFLLRFWRFGCIQVVFRSLSKAQATSVAIKSSQSWSTKGLYIVVSVNMPPHLARGRGHWVKEWHHCQCQWSPRCIIRSWEDRLKLWSVPWVRGTIETSWWFKWKLFSKWFRDVISSVLQVS